MYIENNKIILNFHSRVHNFPSLFIYFMICRKGLYHFVASNLQHYQHGFATMIYSAISSKGFATTICSKDLQPRSIAQSQANYLQHDLQPQFVVQSTTRICNTICNMIYNHDLQQGSATKFTIRIYNTICSHGLQQSVVAFVARQPLISYQGN